MLHKLVYAASKTLAGLAALLLPCVCWPHPMGNFSISHYAGIQIERSGVSIRYIIDMAEIPTFQQMQESGMPAEANDARVAAYVERETQVLARGLHVSVNGHAESLRIASGQVLFTPGAGGLPTMKLAFVGTVPVVEAVDNKSISIDFRDDNFPERIGWKEIIATGASGIRIVTSDVAAKDRSLALTNYPVDMISSPPQQVSAHVEYLVARRPGVFRAAVAPQIAPSIQASPLANPTQPKLAPNAKGTPRNAFTELINRREWGLWFWISAALIAAALGAFHALEPGHGKTMVAAYLVGSQGTARHACLLGLIVTASHTAGVYLLGAIVLYASRYIVPEQLYPWLSVISGVTIAGLGVYLLYRRWRGKQVGHHHHHGHVHDHSHHHHGHDHPHHHHHDHPYVHTHATVSKRQLLALGVTGGIVPCPAALVVLLSAVALHRIAFGLFLIVAFSIGLAAVLIAIGLLMVYARRFMSHVSGEGRMVTRWLPIASAAFITVIGVGIAFQALSTAGVIRLPV